MSQYQITRSCGHVETVQIYGTNAHGERERRAEYEATRPCYDCVRAARAAKQSVLAERAAEAAGLDGWPAINGTDKQVAWATEIRASLVARIAEMIADDAVVAVYVRVLLRQTSARWLIDRRGLVRAPRNPYDAVTSDAGVAEATYGDIIRALDALMTPDERAEVTAADTAATTGTAQTDPGDDTPDTPQAAIGTLRGDGWTVAKIAAECGVHRSTVYRWAAGTRRPTARHSAALASMVRG